MEENNWEFAPREILGKIMNCLSLIDIYSFKLVCHNWYSAMREQADFSLLNPVSSTPPLLVISQPRSESKPNSKGITSFYNLIDKKVHVGEKPWSMPLKEEAKCVGSGYGWLAFIDNKCVMYLINPFNPDVKIQLPSIETLPCVITSWISSDGTLEFHYWNEFEKMNCRVKSHSLYEVFVYKLVMSECNTVMIVYGAMSKLAFCKAGDVSWTPLSGYLRDYDDIYYSSNDSKFYALNEISFTIEAWDLVGKPKSVLIEYPKKVYPSTSTITAEQYFRTSYGAVKIYLAELHENLLLVHRLVLTRVNVKNGAIIDYNGGDDSPYKTCGFFVYRLDRVKEQWVKVNKLGDNGEGVLILGINNCMAFSTRDFPGLQSNSVYFTDDFDTKCGFEEWRGHDLGVFCFNDDRIDECYYPTDFKKIDPPPVWISPK